MSVMEVLPPPAGARNDETARTERLAALARRRPPATSTPANAAMASRRVTSREATASNSNADDTVSSRTKRRHPARSARAAALGLSLVSTGGLATLFAFSGPTGGAQIEAAQIVTRPPGDPTVSAGATPAAAAAPAPTVVDGGVFHNKWGDVQVEATFGPDGTLIDVTALRTPDDRSKSVRINDYAVPLLNAEALASQSAGVDTVSGATYTSNDYRRSLQSAIDAATQSGLAVASA
jgi:uncharacterized protein with FMN-binding domain